MANKLKKLRAQARKTTSVKDQAPALPTPPPALEPEIPPHELILGRLSQYNSWRRAFFKFPLALPAPEQAPTPPAPEPTPLEPAPAVDPVEVMAIMAEYVALVGAHNITRAWLAEQKRALGAPPAPAKPAPAPLAPKPAPAPAPAKPPKAAPKPRAKRVTVSSRAREIIIAGATNAECFEALLAEFGPDVMTEKKRGYPAWYRREQTKAGNMPS